MSLARKLELRKHCAAAVAPPSASPRDQQQGLLAAPPPRLALPAPPPAAIAVATTVTVEGHPVRRLSMTEMEERRRLGLCFNCNEKFGRGHNQVCQRLFLLDLAAADDDHDATPDDHDTTKPPISLHTITGVHTSNTMLVRCPHRLGLDTQPHRQGSCQQHQSPHGLLQLCIRHNG
jgi:hypothetical protein